MYETNDRLQAHLIRSVLEDAGIRAHVAGDALQGAMGELPLTMLSIRVQVAEEDAERARVIALESRGFERQRVVVPLNQVLKRPLE